VLTPAQAAGDVPGVERRVDMEPGASRWRDRSSTRSPIPSHRYNIVRNLFSGWLQDDWKVGGNLTLNLGVRYDWDNNSQGEKLKLMPFLPGNLPHDNNNVAPRDRGQRPHQRPDVGPRWVRIVLSRLHPTTACSRRTR
jgi:outer membrane receptor protein involved in Fe transport